MIPPRRLSVWYRWSWAVALAGLLVAVAWWLRRGPTRREPEALQLQHSLEAEDWSAVLGLLSADPLTNALERLAVARALFETGRLPEDLFSWIHGPGPDLLSPIALRKQRGTAFAADLVLGLGHVNLAERWAFDSLEMEGENPTALKTLVRVHIIRGLPQAAHIFLNRLESHPQDRVWAGRVLTQLMADPVTIDDPGLSRVRSNRVARDELVTRLSADTLLRQALEAHPENAMAFQFLMAEQLLARRVTDAVQTLATYPQDHEGPLPRHYGEAVALVDHLRPGTCPSDLRERVSADVTARFERFEEFMDRAAAGPTQESQPEAWSEFGNTYWYYHFFSSYHRHDPGEHRPIQASKSSPAPAPTEGAPSPPSPVGPGRPPRIEPDYVDVVIPPNLAPLNLTILEPGTEYQLRLAGVRGSVIELRQASPHLRLPFARWKELLEANRGAELRWEVSIRDPGGDWTACAPFTNRVAEEEIDSHLVYRRLQPLFSYYKNLGIYQRNLETFEEQPILRNTTFNHGCLNCHTPAQGSPDRFVLPIRTPFGTPTLLIRSNRVSRVEHKMGYPSWHPNGRLLAFSANTISQYFHIAGPVNRDIYDPRSDLAIYHVDQGTVEKPPAIAQPDRSENWPSWGPGGRYLYFSRAPALAFRNTDRFRYDLLRIPYDADRNEWGEPETLVSAAEQRRSAHQPRVSPDGRFLVFTSTESGSFPVFHPDSDLFCLRLDTRVLQPLAINSDAADTWHSWSSNGRWLVFGSKRLDGVFTRVFITYVGSEFSPSKPLLLPQESPEYYDTCLDNFNLPELVRGPVRISEADLARAVNIGAPTGDSGSEPTAADEARYVP